MIFISRPADTHVETSLFLSLYRVIFGCEQECFDSFYSKKVLYSINIDQVESAVWIYGARETVSRSFVYFSCNLGKNEHN